MSREKAPAFQMYPRDWDTDINVIPMTYEEEGVYFAICRLIWLHNMKVSSNLDELRLLLKGQPTIEQLNIWWKKISKCFTDRGGFLHHKRLAKERRKQSARRKSQSRNGKKGGRPKANGKPRVNQSRGAGKPKKSSALASASAFASADQKTNTPPTPADAGAHKPVLVVVKEKPITRKERAEAEEIFDMCGCPHEDEFATPPLAACVDRDTCVGRQVREKRDRERSGLEGAA
jgi:uncharacterized protein YdaU (DUF1376 family)